MLVRWHQCKQMKTSEHNVRFVLVYLFICAKAHVTISLLFSSLQQSAFILLGTFIYLCSGLWFTFSVRFLCMREFGFFFCVAFPMYFRLYLWYAFKLLNFLLLLKLMFVSFSFWVHVTWATKDAIDHFAYYVFILVFAWDVL